MKFNYNSIIKTSAFLLVLYLFGVIIITILGQSKLNESRINEFNLQVENSLVSIESFLEIQKENINLLSSSKKIESYFINKALGMSLKYGLRANLIKIDKTLEDFVFSKKISDKYIYKNIVVLDENYQFISKNRLALKLENFTNLENEIKIVSYIVDNKLQVFLAKNILVNEKKVGLIIAKLNFKNIINHLLTNFRTKHFIFLQLDKNIIDITDLALLTNEKVDLSDSLMDNILDSNIEILIKRNHKDEYLTSPYFVLVLIILSFVVFYGIYFIFRLSRKNAILNSRIKDSDKLNKILEEKVEEKTKELKEFNDHLKSRVQEEIGKNRENQRILYNQSKMALMGQMLDNIAHQWRQPLSSISTNASGVKLQNELDLLSKDKIDTSMDHIVDSVRFLSETIDDFRDFFKDNKDKKAFKVQDNFNRTKKLLISAMKHSSVQIVEKIDNIEVLGYPNELIQVLLNIINNAIDAFDGSSLEFEKKLVFISIYKDEKFFYIEIKDNAGGIPDEIISKIFDARFTTKGEQKGTGVGLYMTKEIVQEHMKGIINVKNSKYSYEGIECIGAEFLLKMPLDK